jgi:hypothetical protein
MADEILQRFLMILEGSALLQAWDYCKALCTVLGPGKGK